MNPTFITDQAVLFSGMGPLTSSIEDASFPVDLRWIIDKENSSCSACTSLRVSQNEPVRSMN